VSYLEEKNAKGELKRYMGPKKNGEDLGGRNWSLTPKSIKEIPSDSSKKRRKKLL